MAKRKRTRLDALNQQIIACRQCPRLVEHCAKIADEKRRAFMDWEYWGKPVPNFGSGKRKMLIVGLAPAAHGANRTGRMFTGDRSGDWLYGALHRAGFASQAESHARDDGLKLSGCAITAVCHCAPPDNKPAREEIANCRQWLTETIDLLEPRVLLALGQIGWRGVVDQAKRRGWYEGRIPKFGHGTEVDLGNGRVLLGSYHPSQQNTFTGRLTREMFDAICTRARELLDGSDQS